jgi:pimeloyl-ACP methyl ester carboxylesterase
MKTTAALIASLMVLTPATIGQIGAGALPARGAPGQFRLNSYHPKVSASTVWLCKPGMADDPCTSSLRTTVVQASGAESLLNPQINAASKFDCFYVYPTVSTETTTNADLRVQSAEIATAVAQASRFSVVCRVWAPMYRQVTLDGLNTPGLSASSPEMVTSYQSLLAGFEDYLNHYNDGRPIVFIGHSQGAAIVIMLLQHLVDNDPALRSRLVLAIIAGGNVVVPTGALKGGSFANIPLCNSNGEAGCVIAYSSFPGEPPAGAFFGRPGQGVSLMSGQTAKNGLRVACANPASLGGGNATLVPFFPTEGLMATPWVEFPGLYGARCESASGATWLQVTKVTGPSDHRPVVQEREGPDWGYHVADINLALGNLVADTAAAEASWSKNAHAAR